MANVWCIEYASGESSSTTGKTFPVDSDGNRTVAKWFQCIGAGTVVAVCEGGQTFTKHATGGEVYKGSFTSLTSTSCTYLVMGNGPPPPATPANGTAAQATIADAGDFTDETELEGATQEIYQGLLSTQKCIPIPLGGAIDIATGALLAVFSGGVSTTPGTEFTNSKTSAIRWNNDAAPGAIAVNVAMPQDLDETADVTFHALVSKTGATVGDALKLTVGAFEHIPGALHDADSDFGGDTSAVTGDATAKTVTEVTLTLAAANVHAAPSSICFTIKPKAGTLGTDDALLHSAWLEYKPVLLAS
jgi:hypothetical protein